MSFLDLLRGRILSFCTADMGEYDIMQVGLICDDERTYGFFVVFSLASNQDITLFLYCDYDPWMEYDEKPPKPVERLMHVLNENVEYLLSV